MIPMLWERHAGKCSHAYVTTEHCFDAEACFVNVAAHLTADECDALAAALTQAANRKRAMDAERSVAP